MFPRFIAAVALLVGTLVPLPEPAYCSDLIYPIARAAIDSFREAERAPYAGGHGQVDVEVDRDEILRHGNMVQKIDQGWQDEGEAAANDVMGPPADDSAKWFISVISQRGCAPCAHLKADWSASPELMALAKPSEPAASWAHFNFYDADDRSQAFRFSNVQLQAFPTILIQPPRNGQYGDPATVVAQFVGYNGQPKELALKIVSAIKTYVAKRASGGHQQTFGVNPPWTPTPQVPVYNPSPLTPNTGINPLDGLLQVVPPVAPPTVPAPSAPAPVVTVPTTPTAIPSWLMMLALPLVGMAILYGLQQFRQSRVDANKPTILTDEQMKQLTDLISGVTKPK